MRDRVDRIEGFVEVLASSQADLVTEFKRLLTAQVVLTEQVSKLADRFAEAQQQNLEAQRKLMEGHQQLLEAQRHTDERLNALISVVDDLVRRKQ